MRIWPVLLDFVPPYLGHSGGSLLQTPVGADVLVTRLCNRVAALTPNPAVILPPSQSGPGYGAAMQSLGARASVAADGEQLADILPLETSDVFLFVDSRCFPIEDSGMTALLEQFSVGRQVAHHLVAFEASTAGTREHVNIDGNGRVHSVHRYYENATWPFLAGVAASLVPVSSSLLYLDGVPPSLVELRQQLVASGAPSRDVAVEGGAMDLTKRHGLLAAMEHSVVEESRRARATGRSSTVLVGSGHAIAPTARILGPVVIHSNVSIDENATIVGPAVIGAGAQVSAQAVVAHAIVGPLSRVPRERTLRDRVWFNDLDDREHDRPESSYQARLARLSFEPAAASGSTAIPAPAHPAYLPWKRVFDVVASSIGLALLSPLFLLLAILIRLGSRGPVFYRAEREGLGGHRFTCLKFRTMQEGAHSLQHLLKAQDKLDGPHFKLDHDPRVTGLGRILRGTNLDELPQLINVFRGDMSLVGPRPSPFRENQICVPWREGRLSVRPGVTGLWQVCRKDRSLGDFHQWIEYDLLYVQHASPGLDLKILLATVISLAGRVPVPAAWLVRLPPAAPPADKADVGSKHVRPLPPRTAATGKAPASSRTA